MLRMLVLMALALTLMAFSEPPPKPVAWQVQWTGVVIDPSGYPGGAFEVGLREDGQMVWRTP